MSHTDKSLRRSAIEEAIKLFPDYDSHVKVDAGTKSINITTKVKGVQKPAMITVRYLENGNTTIMDHVGRNQELSEKLAHHIVEQCALPVIESKRLYIANMSDEHFGTLIEYLDVDGRLTVSAPQDLQNGKKIAINWNEGGVIYLNRYNNGAFAVQGNSNHAKEVIVELLSQVLPLNDIIVAQMESLEVNITPDQVLSTVEIRMPESFSKMQDSLKAIISPSFALQTINVELEDYSAFAFPILRVTEGVLRTAYDHFGIAIGDGSVGSIFDRNEVTGEHFLQQAHTDNLPNVSTVNAITNLYKVHTRQRHQLFHIGKLVEIPRILETKEEADNIIDEAIHAIEAVYNKL
jgi:hypothetical protein